MTAVLRRLRSGFRKVLTAEARVADARRKLAAANEAVSHWKKKHQALAAEMAASSVNTDDRLRHSSVRGDRLRRHVLEPDILAAVLPVRAATMAARSAAPAAVAREEAFRAASASYGAAAMDRQSFAGQMRAIELMGLTWWVPLTRPGDEAYSAAYAAKQDFPLRTITQTREVGVGGIMLDLGGNVGRMSIPRVILGDVQVAYCAEPEPLNYACLVRNVLDNRLAGLVMPDRVAIGAVDGHERLARGRSSGGHRVLAEPGAVADAIEVPSLTLDSWVERLGIDTAALSFIKVDTQGSELHVLRGASRVLACRHVAWQIEVDPLLLSRRGVEVAQLFAELQQHFTHFIDLNRQAVGARARAIAELAPALSYVTARRDGRTDVLVFTGASVSGSTGGTADQ